MTTDPVSRPLTTSGPPLSRLLLVVSVVLALVGCSGSPSTKQTISGQEGAWAGRRIGPRPAPQPGVRKAMLRLAEREWAYFGRQRVVYTQRAESIPHVGLWEDDDPSRSSRVNLYWRAVGKPGLTGRHCQQPWSAAFMSWLMREAGVAKHQFPPAAAHWVYLSKLIDWSDAAGRYFVPRGISSYRPRPGDLICASKEIPRTNALTGQLQPWTLRNARMHCDLVVKNDGRNLEAIGGNVRNSVSRSTLEVDGDGHLQRVPNRPWVLVLENRL